MGVLDLGYWVFYVDSRLLCWSSVCVFLIRRIFFICVLTGCGLNLGFFGGLLIWFRDKSQTGHSMTVGESVAVYSSEIDGAVAYEVSGIITYCCF